MSKKQNTKKQNTFNVGDVVEWTSQAGGHHKTKVGKVVYKGTSGRQFPKRIAVDLFPDHIKKFDGLSFPRPVGYLVEVEPAGDKAKKMLYMPRPSGLRLLNE